MTTCSGPPWSGDAPKRDCRAARTGGARSNKITSSAISSRSWPTCTRRRSASSRLGGPNPQRNPDLRREGPRPRHGARGPCRLQDPASCSDPKHRPAALRHAACVTGQPQRLGAGLGEGRRMEPPPWQRTARPQRRHPVPRPGPPRARGSPRSPARAMHPPRAEQGPTCTPPRACRAGDRRTRIHGKLPPLLWGLPLARDPDEVGFEDAALPPQRSCHAGRRRLRDPARRRASTGRRDRGGRSPQASPTRPCANLPTASVHPHSARGATSEPPLRNRCPCGRPLPPGGADRLARLMHEARDATTTSGCSTMTCAMRHTLSTTRGVFWVLLRSKIKARGGFDAAEHR